jgi:hypothetical protein
MGVVDLLLPAGFAVVIDGHPGCRCASESANQGIAPRKRRSS